MKDSLKSSLDSINWDFENRYIADKDTVFPFNNRKVYSYPGTFVPEIPFSLIEILSQNGAVVLDPFGGIGTTFVQALIQGRIPISIDNNPIAGKVCRDFFSLFDPEVDLDDIKDSIIEDISDYDEKRNYINEISNERFDGWYEKATYNEISYLILCYDSYASENSTNEALYHLCLSNILTSLSSQNGGWAYFADNVKPKESAMKRKDAIATFKKGLDTITKEINAVKTLALDCIETVYNNNKIDVVDGDFLAWESEDFIGNIDLVITSPPYPRMIDYIKSQRLSFYLNEVDFQQILPHEIGARYRRNQKNTLEEYLNDMKKVNRKIYSLMKKGAYFCYILPLLKDDDDRKGCIDKVISDCKEIGLENIMEIERRIPGTRRSNNIKWAKLKKEQIVIFKKD